MAHVSMVHGAVIHVLHLFVGCLAGLGAGGRAQGRWPIGRRRCIAIQERHGIGEHAVVGRAGGRSCRFRRVKAGHRFGASPRRHDKDRAGQQETFRVHLVRLSTRKLKEAVPAARARRQPTGRSADGYGRAMGSAGLKRREGNSSMRKCDRKGARGSQTHRFPGQAFRTTRHGAVTCAGRILCPVV